MATRCRSPTSKLFIYSNGVILLYTCHDWPKSRSDTLCRPGAALHREGHILVYDKDLPTSARSAPCLGALPALSHTVGDDPATLTNVKTAVDGGGCWQVQGCRSNTINTGWGCKGKPPDDTTLPCQKEGDCNCNMAWAFRSDVCL